MGLGGFFKGVGKGLTKVGKFAAPAALMMTGAGIPAAIGAYRGMDALDKKLSQPKQPQMGRGVSPSFDFASQRFPSMQGASGGMMGGMMGGGRAASPQMNMDDWISAGRNTVNPNWMMPAFNPNQPHPMSRMPPYGNAPMRPQGMPRMQMQGGRPQY